MSGDPDSVLIFLDARNYQPNRPQRPASRRWVERRAGRRLFWPVARQGSRQGGRPPPGDQPERGRPGVPGPCQRRNRLLGAVMSRKDPRPKPPVSPAVVFGAQIDTALAGGVLAKTMTLRLTLN